MTFDHQITAVDEQAPRVIARGGGKQQQTGRVRQAPLPGLVDRGWSLKSATSQSLKFAHGVFCEGELPL